MLESNFKEASLLSNKGYCLTSRSFLKHWTTNTQTLWMFEGHSNTGYYNIFVAYLLCCCVKSYIILFHAIQILLEDFFLYNKTSLLDVLKINLIDPNIK